MEDYIFYALATIGISYFITGSDLMAPMRSKIIWWNTRYGNWFTDKLEGVTQCIYCCSFWVGLILFIMLNRINFECMVLSAFSVMGAIWIVKNLNSK